MQDLPHDLPEPTRLHVVGGRSAREGEVLDQLWEGPALHGDVRGDEEAPDAESQSELVRGT